MMLAQSQSADDDATLLLVSTRGASPFPYRFGSERRYETVELDIPGKSHRARWAVQLDELLSRRTQAVIIVAQGVSCLAVAWWAQLSPRNYLEHIAGALLVAPLTFSIAEASVARSLRPSPGTKLPFPSVVLSGATPIIDQIVELADGWGSSFVDVGVPDEATLPRLHPGLFATDTRLLPLVAALARADHSKNDRWRETSSETRSRLCEPAEG